MLLSDVGRLGWSPFTELRRMQEEMDRFLAGFEGRVAPAARVFPPINLWVGENSVVVTAELAGVKPDDLDISAEEDVLVLRGRREPPVDAERVAWHRRERAYGAFARTVELPFRIDPDKVRARFHNGLLEVELTRPDSDRPKRIAITRE